MAKRDQYGIRADMLRSISGAGNTLPFSGGQPLDDPSAYLSDTEREVYSRLVAALPVDRKGKYATLLSLAEAAKLQIFIRESEAQIAQEGRVLVSERSGAAKSHPLINSCATARGQILKIMSSAGLLERPHAVVARREQAVADAFTEAVLADEAEQFSRRQ